MEHQNHHEKNYIAINHNGYVRIYKKVTGFFTDVICPNGRRLRFWSQDQGDLVPGKFLRRAKVMVKKV